MSFMFSGAYELVANLSSWNTSKEMIMVSMFQGASSFQGIGLEYWETSNVRDMTDMFYVTGKLRADLSSWNTSKVLIM
jgi:surface protein